MTRVCCAVHDKGGVNWIARKLILIYIARFFTSSLRGVAQPWHPFFVIASHRRWRGDPGVNMSRVARTLFTGLLRCARNDKIGVGAHDKGVLCRA